MTTHVLTLAQFCALLPTLGDLVWRHEMIHLLLDDGDGKLKGATLISEKASEFYGLKFYPIKQKAGYAIAVEGDDQQIVEFILCLG